MRILGPQTPRRAATSPASSGAGFRRLAHSAVMLTFALVVVGGIVRVSDSGLGCGAGGSGTEGWPLCGGRVIPLVDTNMIIEYSHRVLAGALALVIAVLAFVAIRHHRERGDLVRVSCAALGLVLFQAALGGLTVEKGLEEELVATHLGVAMLQLGLLIVLAYLLRSGAQPSKPGTSSPTASSPGQGVRVLAVLATTAVLATIVAGGYMSASELHGTEARGPDVHTACGSAFPSCDGAFLPFGRDRALDIHLTHRAFMYLGSALVLALFAVTLVQRRRRPGAVSGALARAAGVAAGILCVQVLLGALNVWLGEHEWLIVGHLTVGTMLWCSLVVVLLLALRAPRHVVERTPGKPSVQAVPA